MALRAGYYGIKRKLRDKLETVAAGWDNLFNSVNTPVEKTLTPAEGITLGSNTKCVKLGRIVDLYVSITSVSAEADTTTTLFTLPSDCLPLYSLFDVGYDSDGSAVRFNISSTSGNVQIRHLEAISNKTIVVHITFIAKPAPTRELSMAAAPEEIVKDEIEEPIVEKKTTKKKSTAKAETQEEV